MHCKLSIIRCIVLASVVSTVIPDDLNCSADHGFHRLDGQPLHPKDLPPIQLYQDWQNSTVLIHTKDDSTTILSVSSGSIQQAGDYTSNAEVLSGIVSKEEVHRMLQLLNAPWLQTSLDQDPDTVDGYTTQEFFLDNDSLRKGESGKPAFESQQQAERRRDLRQAFMKITQPVLEERITPYVNQRFEACQGQCTPCYSLIRRYMHGERLSHAPHRDGHALVTMVVSLSDYGIDYVGGLYVASESGHPYYLKLNKGDAAVHQSDLLHGVKVYPVKDGVRTTRWSWILWFRDSEQCEDNSYQWFKDCAQDGNPTCQMMHATKVGNIPGISQDEAMREMIRWNQKAAEMGHATACVKLARALLGKLPSNLEKDRDQAMTLFKRAIQSSNDPDAHYGLATVYLEDATMQAKQGLSFKSLVEKAVAHLEASAIGGHPFAMFNLGMAHMLGYATKIDFDLAGEWFEASGLPEGLAARSMYYSSVGALEKAAEFQRRALSLGYGAKWRVMARESTGYGGAGGIDLNLPWPPNDSNQVPPRW